MDLGALELQIFVSLVVVLGAAFVALVCDYLKGNNEQLRERNIELRVRTEERERFAILNPSAWLSQFRSRPDLASTVEAGARRAPQAPETVMESQAPEQVLAQAAEREADLLSRTEHGETEFADVPPVAGFDVSARRRSRRKRGMEGKPDDEAKGNSYDWVRPEVMARVARKAGRGEREAAEAELAPLGADATGVDEKLQGPELPLGAESVPVLEEAVGRELRPLEVGAMAPARQSGAPPVILLRPLPTMKLAEELERVAAPVAAEPVTSQLLDEVIAASAAKPAVVPEVVVPETVLSETVLPEAISLETVLPETVLEEVGPSEEGPAVVESAAVIEDQAVVELPRQEAEPADDTFGSPMYSGSAFAEALSSARDAELTGGDGEASKVLIGQLAETGETGTEQLPMLPSDAGFPAYDLLDSSASGSAYDWSNASEEALPEVGVPAELPELAAELTEVPGAAPANEMPELLLPAGMQDLATYRRLLSMPNPMNGIVIAISINDFDRLGGAEGEGSVRDLLDSVEGLMDSMVRDGDFGVKVSADQWMFVYPIDDKGMSQRRVSGLSEKLWDFQLRHLGQSNISFSWAAVNVREERLSEAVNAAMERMEASRQGNQKGGSGRPRLVANG